MFLLGVSIFVSSSIRMLVLLLSSDENKKNMAGFFLI
jgi:hypothetical protein